MCENLKYNSLTRGLLLSFSILLICSGGCIRKAAELNELKQKTEVLKVINENYYKYAHGELNAAKKSLLQSISTLENSTCFDNKERASLICLEYSRLAVMAYKLKDKDGEEAYFLGAKYCQLRFLELSDISLQEAIKQVDQMSIENQTVIVEKMDAKLLNGKLANYNQNIPIQ